jgi:hypothetical protein
LDVENCLRPPELAVKMCDFACEPLVLLDQRRVRGGLAATTLRRQGLERGRIALLSPCCKMRRIEPFAPEQGAELPRRRRLISLAEDPGLVLRIDAGAPSPVRPDQADLGLLPPPVRRPRWWAELQSGQALLPFRPPSLLVVQSSFRSPSAWLLALYSHGDKAGVSPIIGTEGTLPLKSRKNREACLTLSMLNLISQPENRGPPLAAGRPHPDL